MSVGFLPNRETITGLEQRQVLWRMQGPRRVVTAALYRHPAGTEFRVCFELESRDDLLVSQVERFDVGLLRDRATALRSTLIEKGWLEPQSPDRH